MQKYYFLSKKITFWLMLGLLAFILLYPKFPLLNVKGTYVAIRIEDFLIALLTGIWFFGNLKNLKKIFSTTLGKAFLLFWAIGLLSVLSGIFITFSVKPQLALLHWLRRIEFMSLFFVAATTTQFQSQTKWLLKVLLLVTIVVCVYGFGQMFLSLPVVSTTNREFSKGLILKLTPEARPNSTFAGYYDLAVYLSIVLIFLSSLLFFYKKLWEKALVVLISIPSAILLALTAARTSFLATVLGVAGVFWLLGKKWFIFALFVMTLSITLMVPQLRNRLVATLNVNLLSKGTITYNPTPNPSEKKLLNLDQALKKVQKDKLNNVLNTDNEEATKEATKEGGIAVDTVPGEPTNYTELEVSRSLNIRLNVEWPRAIAAFEKNPILGTGYSSLTIATDNDILRSLGETGLLGTASLVLIFVIIFKNLLANLSAKDRFERFFIIASVCSLINLLITGVFIDVFEASKIASLLWVLLGLAWAISNGFKYD